MIIKLFYILSILFVFTNFLYSQNKKEVKTYETEEIIIEGYKVNTDIFTSPTKIKLISSDEIKNKNGNRLSDIIEMSGNVYIKSYGGNSTLKTISLNGLSAEHTIILFDGNKLNSFQNSQIDLSQISKDNIERIEIINDGISSIYGSEAVSGVINIISNNPESLRKTKINLSSQFGSFGFRKYFAKVNQSFNRLSFSASLNLESSKDDFNYYFSNGNDKVLLKRENSDFNFKDFNFAVNYYLNNKSSLKLLSNYTDNRRNIPGIETGTPSSISSQQDYIWTNFLTYENKINDFTELKSSISFQNNLSRYESRPLINSFYRNLSLSSNSQIKVKKLSDLIIGYDLIYGRLSSNDLVNYPERFQTGIYLINSIKLFRNNSLIVYPSLRYDYYSDTKINNISARIGLNYNLLGRDFIYFKTNLGNNFRVPTFNELYWKHGGNENLSQEKSINIDAGFIVNYYLYFKNLFELTYSFNKISDKIIWKPNVTGFWTPENLGNVTVNNLNIESKSEKSFSEYFKTGFDIIFNYCRSLNKLSITNDMYSEKQQIYVPEISFKVNTGIEYRSFNLNIFYQYISRRYTDYNNDYYLPSIELFDGNFSYNIKIKDIKLSLRFEVNNIFNEDYQMISGYPMSLRNFKFGLQLNY